MKQAQKMKLSELLSSKLIARDGSLLGQVTDILISADDHRAEYLVVTLSETGESVPLRYSAAVVDSARGCFVLNTSSDIARQLVH